MEEFDRKLSLQREREHSMLEEKHEDRDAIEVI